MKATQGNLKLLDTFESILRSNNVYDEAALYKNIIHDMNSALKNGDIYTNPRAITSQEELIKSPENVFTTSSGKEVIILTNPNCYSSCDLFVGLMKDQGLATKMIGEARNTGGGGASVLSWSTFQSLNLVPYRIPKSAEMTFSWMQMQSRTKTGEYRTIEGKGTEVDCVISKTISEIKATDDKNVKNMSYVKRILENINNDSICEKD